MKDDMYIPNGEVQGGQDIPDAGNKTGGEDFYGADVSPDATNSMGKMSGTKSDPMDARCSTTKIK